MSATPASDARPEPGALNPRRWLVAAVMMVAALMDLLDGTVVNIALPTVQRDLHASGDQLAWVVSAYLLAFAAALITAGQLGDRFGRRKLFLIGTAAFGVASLASAVAQTPGQLIVFRVIQGAAAATVAPQVLATFRVIFPREERGKAFAMYGAVGGLAASVGLIAGGALTSANLFGTGWRMIFIVNVPIALAIFVVSLALVPETRIANPLRPDVVGTVLMAAGIVAVVYPLLEGQRRGWPVWCWVLLSAGVVALVGLFVVDSRHQSRGAATLLPTPLLKVPAFGAGIAVQLFFSGAMTGSILALTLWVQSGQGWSPIHAGLVLTSFALGTIITAPMSDGLGPRFGRQVLVLGALLLAAGTGGAVAGGAPRPARAARRQCLAARSAAARRGHGARPARRTADQRRAGRRAGRPGRLGVRAVQHRPAAGRGGRRGRDQLGLLRLAAGAWLRAAPSAGPRRTPSWATWPARGCAYCCRRPPSRACREPTSTRTPSWSADRRPSGPRDARSRGATLCGRQGASSSGCRTPCSSTTVRGSPDGVRATTHGPPPPPPPGAVTHRRPW